MARQILSAVRAAVRPGAADRLRALLGQSATGVALEVAAAAGVALSAPVLLAAGALPHTAAPEEPAPDEAGGALPVVLVHGFAASPNSWVALRRALRARGGTVVTFDYAPWESSVEAIADRLSETVEEVLAATGAPRVHLVGHSLGGVIIAQALAQGRLAGRVDLVVTIGSPFRGSPWAALLPGVPLVSALRADSPLLRRLAAVPVPAGVRWLAFSASFDPVVPGHRAFPAHPEVVRIGTAAAGHSGLLLHPEIIAGVVAATAPPEPDAEAEADADAAAEPTVTVQPAA